MCSVERGNDGFSRKGALIILLLQVNGKKMAAVTNIYMFICI